MLIGTPSAESIEVLAQAPFQRTTPSECVELLFSSVITGHSYYFSILLLIRQIVTSKVKVTRSVKRTSTSQLLLTDCYSHKRPGKVRLSVSALVPLLFSIRGEGMLITDHPSLIATRA